MNKRFAAEGKQHRLKNHHRRFNPDLTWKRSPTLTITSLSAIDAIVKMKENAVPSRAETGRDAEKRCP